MNSWCDGRGNIVPLPSFSKGESMASYKNLDKLNVRIFTEVFGWVPTGKFDRVDGLPLYSRPGKKFGDRSLPNVTYDWDFFKEYILPLMVEMAKKRKQLDTFYHSLGTIYHLAKRPDQLVVQFMKAWDKENKK